MKGRSQLGNYRKALSRRYTLFIDSFRLSTEDIMSGGQAQRVIYLGDIQRAKEGSKTVSRKKLIDDGNLHRYGQRLNPQKGVPHDRLTPIIGISIHLAYL